MLFNSFSFLIFFPIVTILYYVIPKKWQILLLLVASCIFYMSFVPWYILILLTLITIDFFLAQTIEKHSGKERKFFLIASLIANLGLLFTFKYFNFFNTNIASLADLLHWQYPLILLKIALPIGLSFHIFQSLAYVIEVYRGKYIPEKNYLNYALYVLFFPQLVAGPIERPANLLPQFNLEHKFNALDVRRGLERMLWGFFKKLVIADNIAIVVDYVYSGQQLDGPALIITIILFTYQLYCDFSGYSDIALGSAQVLGYKLTENFNRPFAAKSITEFWRRWHISLSSWLRDYLYYPLAFSCKKITKAWLYFSLFITFVLIGLWHGANWTFVIFGAIHGFYLIAEAVKERIISKRSNNDQKNRLQKIYNTLKTLLVFLLVSVSLIFFRAKDLNQSWQIIKHLSHNISSIFELSYVRYELLTTKTLGITKSTFLIITLAVIAMEIVQRYQDKKNSFYLFEDKSKKLRYAWYYALILAILIFGYLGKGTFIYFQF